MPSLRLKSGREKSVLQHHPWIFSGSVEKVTGDPPLGGTVKVLSSRGDFLAWAAYSPHSRIRARIWSWNPDQAIDTEFLQNRVKKATAHRDKLTRMGVLHMPSSSHIKSKKGDDQDPVYHPAIRLIHAESDGMPGLVVDRYNDILVIQLLSAGIEYWRETIADILLEQPGVERIYERSDVDVRSLEGLPLRTGPLRGDQPPDLIEIREFGLRFQVDIKNGHKTGFYLDQRESRLFIRSWAQGCRVLDGFAYTGGMGINALVGGAKQVTVVESSGQALTLARQNYSINGLNPRDVEWVNGDVFHVLREFRDRDQKFDLIILDPPKFAPTPAHVHKASRGYKDINLLAFKLLDPGGTLVTFSCSGGVDMDLFQKIVASAALDAGVNSRIVRQLHQSWDHPIALNFPEGAYLKGLVIQIS